MSYDFWIFSGWADETYALPISIPRFAHDPFAFDIDIHGLSHGGEERDDVPEAFRAPCRLQSLRHDRAR